MINQFDREPLSLMEIIGIDKPKSVNTYADLPPANENLFEKYFVNTTTGSLLLGNKKNAGIYISDGTTWELLEKASYDDIDALKANKAITITAGTGLTGGGDLSANRIISHGATGLATSITNTNGNVIQSLTLDNFSGGHITASSSVNLDNRYTLKNVDIIGATKTKITYDSKGLITAGADATTTDIAEGTNQYFTQARARTSVSLTTTGSSGASTYNNTTGVLNIPNYTLAGLGGQPQLNGIGFVKASGTTISYDNNTYLTANQSITLSGDVSGTGTTAITTTLANSGATAGTYQNATTINPFTIDSKGRITLVGTATTITPAFSSITSKPTTISGYGITDGVTLTGSQTLTNKNLDDATTFIIDNIDTTKKATFDASSITTATTRTYTLPNVNGTLITTGDTGTVSNTMLAGSIADTKLNTISTAGKVANSATTATNANTANTIVSRDASGNFSAGTITATLTGNASTTTALQTARTINGVSFDGTANITIADSTKQPLNTNLTSIGAVANSAGWLYNNGTGIFSYSSPTTSNVSEGTNLYYTNARAIASTLTGYISGAGTISATDTILSAIQKLNGNIGALITGVSSVFGRTGAVVATKGDYSLNLLNDVVITTPTNGQVLKYNGINWINNTDNGITSINGLTTLTQTFATGTTGTDFSISSSTSTHTFNLPTASATNRGALSSTDWSTFNNKENVLTFSTPLSRATNTISISQANSTTDGFLSSIDWNSFNNKQNAITLTTTGSSGASTFASNTLNIPNYTLAGLGGQAQLNGTGFVKATGTTISYDNSSYLPLTGGTLTGQLISTQANNTATGGGQIYLNGATGNRIDFNTGGGAIPSFTTRSVGTKIVLYPRVDATNADYAIGISSGALWQSVPQNVSTSFFRWYGGTTNLMSLRGDGKLMIGGIEDSRGIVTINANSESTYSADTDMGDAGRYFVMQNYSNTNIANQFSTITMQINPTGAIPGGRVLCDIRLIRETINATNGFFLFSGFIQLGVYKDFARIGYSTNYFIGNTGIGISTPSYKLDVNGTTRLNGVVRFGYDTWHLSEDGKNRLYFANNGTTYFGSQSGYVWRSANDTTDILTLNNTGELTQSQTADGIGLTLPYGGRIYKKSGSGIVIRKANNNTDIQVENNDGTNTIPLLTTQTGELKKTFSLPNTFGTTQWIKLGEATNMSQDGTKIIIKLFMSSGYNADINQNQISNVYFKTANGGSFVAGSTGNFYGDGYYTIDNISSTIAPSIIRVVQVSNTNYQFFIYQDVYSGLSFYDVSYANLTWTNAASFTSPTGNYIDLVKIPQIPKFVGSLTNATSLSAFLEPIPYTTDINDTTFFNNSSGNITVYYKGTYEIICQGSAYHTNASAGMTTEYAIRRWRSGVATSLSGCRARHIATSNSTQGSQSVYLSCIATLQGGDIIKVSCYVADGSATTANLQGGNTYNIISIKKLND